MEEQQFDAQAMMGRAGELMRYVRSSEAFPVLLVGIAGGIAGALMAVIIASRVAHSHTGEEPVREDKRAENGWNLREVVQLATIGATLVKQAQDWYQERKQEQSRYS